MSRTIHIDIFDPASIDAAVREIEDYKKWLQERTSALEEKVAAYIQSYAQEGFNGAISDNIFSVENGSPVDYSEFANVKVYVTNDGNVTIVTAFGKNAVFVEFGAGVYYNGAVGSSPNPMGNELGFTIGSYGKGNGAKNTWGFYGADGEFHLTHGVPASMPMYKAMMAVIQNIVEIAKEVFRT